MKAKLGVLILLTFIISAGIGVSYAYTNGDINPLGVPSSYCDVAFVGEVYASDNEVEKFIGEVDAWLTDETNPGEYNGIWVEIYHAYPSYEVYIDFTVKNTGERPIDVNGLVPISYDPLAMAFTLTGDISTTTSLDIGETVDGRLVILVLNTVNQNDCYEFEVGIGFSGENCCPDPVVLNPGFENPVVTHSSGWDIFPNGDPDLGWNVEWADDYSGAPFPANLELHRGVNGWLPYEGSQYAELDSDWDGPNGNINGEEASVKISQSIITCSWETYTLSFAWSARPNHADNGLKVYWDGVEVFDSGIVAGSSNTDWHVETITGLTVSDSTTIIEFVETGTPDSFGMFLDAVSVQIE